MSASPRQAAFEMLLDRDRARREARRQAVAEAKRRRLARKQRERTARPRLKPISDEQASAYDVWMRVPWLQQCEACKVAPATERHHVIDQQTLRAHASAGAYDFEAIRWDVRNRLLLCSDCHERHTNASRRIPFVVLRPENVEFARELKLDWFLDRRYSA